MEERTTAVAERTTIRLRNGDRLNVREQPEEIFARLAEALVETDTLTSSDGASVDGVGANIGFVTVAHQRLVAVCRLADLNLAVAEDEAKRYAREHNLPLHVAIERETRALWNQFWGR